MSGPADDQDQILAAVGIDDLDERVYRFLLTRPSATPAEVATELKLTGRRANRALTALRGRGLITQLSGRPRRYAMTDPEPAIAALIRQRSGELAVAREAASALSAVFHATQRIENRGGPIELLPGSAELGRWFVRLQQQAREEMLVLDRPPYALAATNPVEPGLLADGLAWRAIYAPEALEQPGAMEEVAELARLGEQGRVLPDLPIKLAIADRRLAMMPLHFDLATAPVALIRESLLLDALICLFEQFWERAVPIGPDQPDAELGDTDRTLITLLTAGLTDTAIARQMGWSTRTMRRRVSAIFDQLSVSNRFQAGVQATRRGWI